MEEDKTKRMELHGALALADRADARARAGALTPRMDTPHATLMCIDAQMEVMENSSGQCVLREDSDFEITKLHGQPSIAFLFISIVKA